MADVTNEHGPPSEVVAARVKEARKRRGWNATQLAQRCAEIGAPELTAQAIANIENGRRDATGRRRRHVTVDEVLALAIALDVAPVHLMVPLEEGAYWVTPRGMTKIGLVRHWIRGTEPFPSGDRRVFFSEVPEQEWEPPPPLSAEDIEAWREFAAAAERAGLTSPFTTRRGGAPDDGEH